MTVPPAKAGTLFYCPEADLAARMIDIRRTPASMNLPAGMGVSFYRTAEPDIWLVCKGTMPLTYQRVLRLEPIAENEMPFKPLKAV